MASRALAPSSKLAATGWVAGDVHIDGLDQVSDDACYRAMDELHAMEDDFGKKVYDNLAHLLNLEVDLLFFDTTSTYFETGDADEVLPRDQNGGAPAAARRLMKPPSAATARARTPGPTCRRSSWEWPSPATGSRCAAGAGPGTPATPR